MKVKYLRVKLLLLCRNSLSRKIFSSLREQGAKVVKEITYPDHHIYDENDLLYLAETANKNKSILVSTKKDFVRIPKSYRSLINTLEGDRFWKKKV